MPRRRTNFRGGNLKFWIAFLVVSTLIVISRELTFLLTSPSPLEAERGSYPTQFDQTFVPWLRKMVAIRDVARKHPTTKWVVIDGVTSPCFDISEFTQREDWGVVLVSSGKKEPQGCRSSHCIVLNEGTYEGLMEGFAVTKLLSKPNKLSAYLVAISLGAEVIVDAKCGAPSNHKSISQHPFWDYPDLPTHSLFYNDTGLFNPFQHFGHQAFYPKGFQHLFYSTSQSLNQTDCFIYKGGCQWYHTNSNMYYLKDVTNSNDAIWQSSSRSEDPCATSDAPIQSSNSNPLILSPVSLSHSTLAPLDTGLTLFPRRAFHLMFLPVDLPNKTQELFRTIFVHLMRSCLSLLITYLGFDHRHQTINYSFDNIQTERITSIDLNTVLNFSCDMNTCSSNISDCAIVKAKNTVNIFFEAEGQTNPAMRNKILALLLAWLRDIGRFNTASTLSKTGIPSIPHPVGKDAFKVKYSLQLQSFENLTPKQSAHITRKVFDKMHSVCSGVSKTPYLSLDNWRSPFIYDIALIIVLNYEFLFETLTYLEYLYRSSFQYIVYCGPSVEEFNVFVQNNGFQYVTYIDGFTHEWHFMYECMTHAMKLGLPVNGYLQIGDDVLLNTRKLATLSRNRIWMPKGFTKRHLYRNNSAFHWYHWGTSFGKSAVLNTFKELESIVTSGNSSSFSRESEEKNKNDFQRKAFAFAERFLTNYNKNIGRNNVIHRAIDIFYVPDVLREEYIIASELFRKHTVIIELAVPVLHLGLVPKSEVIYLQGASLWKKDRVQSWKFYNESSTFFIHPFKSLSHLDTLEGKQFFCLQYLPKLVDSANVENDFW